MLSNRTASFKMKEESEIQKKNETIQKQLTTPLSLPKLEFNYIFMDEKEKEREKENSNFSFKNDLLSKRTYNFLKGKDECLSTMMLDDSVPTQK